MDSDNHAEPAEDEARHSDSPLHMVMEWLQDSYKVVPPRASFVQGLEQRIAAEAKRTPSYPELSSRPRTPILHNARPSFPRWTFVPLAAALLTLFPIAPSARSTPRRSALADLTDQLCFRLPTGEYNDAGHIYLMNSNGTSPVRVVGDDRLHGKHPDWSPDGTSLVYAEAITGTIWSIRLGDEFPAKLFDPRSLRQFCDYPAWSPDGTQIAFTRYESDGAYDPRSELAPTRTWIMILDLSSGECVPVATSELPYLIDVPRWSPDGKSLVVAIDHFDDDLHNLGSTIATLPLHTGELEPLLPFTTFAYRPDWNPQSDEIVYSTETYGYTQKPTTYADRWNLHTFDLATGHARQLTDVQADEYLSAPTWSRNGTAIYATLSDALGRFAVRIDPSDGTVTRINGVSPQTQIRAQPGRM